MKIKIELQKNAILENLLAVLTLRTSKQRSVYIYNSIVPVKSIAGGISVEVGQKRWAESETGEGIHRQQKLKIEKKMKKTKTRINLQKKAELLLNNKQQLECGGGEEKMQINLQTVLFAR